jgi:hypothetical protein
VVARNVSPGSRPNSARGGAVVDRWPLPATPQLARRRPGAKIAAPRSIEMGTISSPWHYDATRRAAILQSNARQSLRPRCVQDGAPMRVGRKSRTGPIGLGLRALKGGGVVVGVVVDEGDPRVVLSTFLPTATDGDRLALEPYRVASEMMRGPGGGGSTEATAAVAEGHKRQGELAAKGLGDIARKLRDAGCQPVIAALLVNRAGWISDALAYSLYLAGACADCRKARCAGRPSARVRPMRPRSGGDRREVSSRGCVGAASLVAT